MIWPVSKNWPAVHDKMPTLTIRSGLEHFNPTVKLSEIIFFYFEQNPKFLDFEVIARALKLRDNEEFFSTGIPKLLSFQFKQIVFFSFFLHLLRRHWTLRFFPLSSEIFEIGVYVTQKTITLLSLYR